MPPKKRRCWDPEVMKKAVDAVLKKEMGYFKAAKYFSVPQTTLEDYVRKCKNSDLDINKIINQSIGRKPVLPQEIENELARYSQVMDERYYGLRSSDIRSIAFQLALRNRLPNDFNKNMGTAGKKWLRGFLKRHPKLTFRTPEKLSVARAKGFTKEKVNAFFKLLKDDAKILDFPPRRIYNCDETGITVVQGRTSKVLSIKGKKSVSTISSAERGALMTIVTCMSPTGHFVPPLVIFPRKKTDENLKNGAPLGAVVKCHPSGWIQLSTFSEWFEHFMENVKPTLDDPVMLILDGHYSHTKNINVIDRAREKGVRIVCLPPHTTHRLQPLDVSFMAPFKRYYSTEVENWLFKHPFQCLKDKDVGPLMGRAYSRAATLEVAANGFRKCGIYPFDPLIFPPDTFPIEEMTDMPTTVPSPETTDQQNPPLAGFVSPFEVSPPPLLPPPKTTARSGKAAVVTASPFKNALAESIAKKEKSVTKRKLQFFCTKKQKKKTAVSSTSLAEASTSGVCKGNSKRKLFVDDGKLQKKTKRKKQEEDSGSESDSSLIDDVILKDSSSEFEEDEDCLYCFQQWSTDMSKDTWIRCIKCFRWAHELCAGIEKNDWKNFKCDLCIKKDK